MLASLIAQRDLSVKSAQGDPGVMLGLQGLADMAIGNLPKGTQLSNLGLVVVPCAGELFLFRTSFLALVIDGYIIRISGYGWDIGINRSRRIFDKS